MLKTLLAGATAALALAAASSAGAITTFATYTQVDPSLKPFTWTATTSGGGTLTASNVAVTLNIAGFGTQSALFNFTGTIPNGNPAVIDGGGTSLIETGLNGSFSFFNGATNLLSGSFTNGLLSVEGTSGNARASTVTGDSITYTSSLVPAATLGAPRDFSFALTGATPSASQTTGGAIGSFVATGSGNFSATPVARVPEPASWALMIVGFGGMGAALRRRRTKVAFAA
ncbi:MAG: PEPxxWA-CTERM sorting domain-containing protein [Phenylobacterium sp.]